MKLLLFHLFLMLAQVAGAVGFTQDGITYVSTGENSVGVVFGNNAKGNIQLPEKITVGTVEYTVTSIGDSAFIHDFDLTGIKLPSTLKTIGKAAFGGCVNLSKISIPASVNAIGQAALLGCRDSILVESGNRAYTSIDGVLYNVEKNNLIQCPTSASGIFTVPSEVMVLSTDAFWRCSRITHIQLPGTIQSIASGAFAGCTGLLQVELPTGLANLSPNMFSGCTGLAKITIQEGTTAIGSAAFWNCKSLNVIDTWARTAPTLSDTTVFYNTDKKACMLNVPVGCRDTYQAAFGWKQFAGITDNLHVSLGEAILQKPEVLFDGFSNQMFTRNMEKNAPYSVYDCIGKLVYCGRANGLASCPLPQLKPGIYVLAIQHGKSVLSVKFKR